MNQGAYNRTWSAGMGDYSEVRDARVTSRWHNIVCNDIPLTRMCIFLDDNHNECLNMGRTTCSVYRSEGVKCIVVNVPPKQYFPTTCIIMVSLWKRCWNRSTLDHRPMMHATLPGREPGTKKRCGVLTTFSYSDNNIRRSNPTPVASHVVFDRANFSLFCTI